MLRELSEGDCTNRVIDGEEFTNRAFNGGMQANSLDRLKKFLMSVRVYSWKAEI